MLKKLIIIAVLALLFSTVSNLSLTNPKKQSSSGEIRKTS